MQASTILEAALAETLPERLPPLTAVRRSGSWPLGLLPLDLVTGDLAARGTEYRKGSGFSLLGAPVDDQELARMASVYLEIAADSLWSPTSPSEVFQEVLTAAERDQDRALVFAHRERGDDYEAAVALASALSTGPDYWRAAADRALHSGETLAKGRAAEAEGDTWEDHAAALRVTAREVRSSPSAQAILFRALRAHLPAPSAPTASEEDANAFLRTYDAEPRVDRARLGDDYERAGSPGGLGRRALFRSASARWGEPRPYNGRATYRPAQTERPSA